MTETQRPTVSRPYGIFVTNGKGFDLWAGRRSRTFGTLEAARGAAVNLAAEALTHSPSAVAVEIRWAPDGAARHLGRVVEVVKVTAE